MVKNLPAMRETWGGKIPWRRACRHTPVFLPGESPSTEEPGGLQSMGVTKNQMQLSDSAHTALCTFKEVNRQATDIFAQGLYPKCTDNSTLKNKKTNSTIKKWAKDQNRYYSEDIQVSNRHMKRYSISFVIGEIKIKTVRYYYTPIDMAKI